MPVHDQLLGATQPVLSISLEPGESIVAATGEFAWMTDTIQMTADHGGMSAYTAKARTGTVAFASRLPGNRDQHRIPPAPRYRDDSGLHPAADRWCRPRLGRVVWRCGQA
jgi:uncharacterized protein (AIM24 family)